MALTDFLDGYLARKWKVTSDFGRMIDPIADKLFVAGCLIAICILYKGWHIYLIPALAIIGRDIFVSGLREHAALNGIKMPPTKLAKWKTACEMLAIFLILLSLVITLYQLSKPSDWVMYPPLNSSGISDPLVYVELAGVACLWVAAILSVLTGIIYLRAALKN